MEYIDSKIQRQPILLSAAGRAAASTWSRPSVSAYRQILPSFGSLSQVTHPVQIIGHPGCGKTTLMIEIIEALVDRNIRVGSIKHSAHSHELDKPGKDSFCHRIARAVPVAMMTRDMAAIFLPRDLHLSIDDLIRQYYASVDIVLIKGWISGPYEKIEIYGNGCDRLPLFHQVGNVRAFVTDQAVSPSDAAASQNLHIKIFDRAAIRELVAYILS